MYWRYHGADGSSVVTEQVSTRLVALRFARKSGDTQYQYGRVDVARPPEPIDLRSIFQNIDPQLAQ